MIGAFCTKIKMPVCDRRVTTFPAWLASTKAEIITGCPRETMLKHDHESHWFESEIMSTPIINHALRVQCTHIGLNSLMDQVLRIV
jgi:hypothetical protein